MSEPGAWGSALVGAGISLGCVLVWIVTVALARRGGRKRFLTAHLGGIGVRLTLAGGLSVWALAGLGVQPGAFLVSLLGTYTLFMIFEVYWTVRQRRLAAGNTDLSRRTEDRC